MNHYLELVLAMGVAWALSGIIRIILVKRHSPESPYVIAVITVFLINLLDNLLRPDLIPMRILNFIYPITRLSFLLVGPALYFYVQILLKKNFKITAKSSVHAIPFFIWFVIVLIQPENLHPQFILGESSGIFLWQTGNQILRLSFFWDLSSNLSRLSYCAFILSRVQRHSKQLPDLVSNTNRNNTLSWLVYLILFYTGLYLLISLITLLFPADLLLSRIFASIGRNLPPVLFVFIFSLFSADQPILSENLGIGEKSAEVDKKYEKSGIGDKEIKELYSKLVNYLEQSKAYLDPELTLDLLSSQLGETRHRISEVINRESGKKFYTFINTFRIKEFLQAIETNRYPDYTILAVAFECGFRSSSAFYTLFKAEYGMTPRRYLLLNNQQLSE
jgi:AraC-like DNA-binding protein